MGEAGDAKCRIASRGPSIEMNSVTSWRTKRNFGLRARCAMFRSSLVTKLSRPITSLPSASRRSARWLPRKPAAPVMAMRIGDEILREGEDALRYLVQVFVIVRDAE